MALRREDSGLSHKYYGDGVARTQSALDKTQNIYDNAGFDFDYGLYDPNQQGRRNGWTGNRSRPELLEAGSQVAGKYNPEEIRENMYLPEREEYAEDMFELFDQYRPHAEYIAENAGVSGAELTSNLAESGARYNANADAMMGEAERDLQRMGVNPNSGRYASMITGNALGKAAGYSVNQNQVRQQMGQQDMGERMQAAQMGMQFGQQGMDTYGQMGNDLNSSKQFYDQMGEQSRQFDIGAKQQADAMRLQKESQVASEALNRHRYATQQNSSGGNGYYGLGGNYNEWTSIEA